MSCQKTIWMVRQVESLIKPCFCQTDTALYGHNLSTTFFPRVKKIELWFDENQNNGCTGDNIPYSFFGARTRISDCNFGIHGVGGSQRVSEKYNSTQDLGNLPGQ